MHVLSLPQNKFGLVFFRLFDGALETSNFRFEEARSAITLLRCFLHENTQRGKIARVKFAEELSTMSKNRLRWITLERGPIWRIHSLTLMISCHFISSKPKWNNCFIKNSRIINSPMLIVFRSKTAFASYVLSELQKRVFSSLYC